MFYYLSFLRPPPRCAPLSSPITITPQLANDLRTELLDDVQDIYYSWSPIDLSPSPSSSKVPPMTKPRKLTTWRQGSAYKEILVPLPPGLREGQRYSLVLTSHDQGFPHVINLAGPSCGARPLPVLAVPILFTSRKQETKKQERIERFYRIPTSPGSQVFLKVTEQTSFDLDKVSRTRPDRVSHYTARSKMSFCRLVENMGQWDRSQLLDSRFIIWSYR